MHLGGDIGMEPFVIDTYADPIAVRLSGKASTAVEQVPKTIFSAHAYGGLLIDVFLHFNGADKIGCQ